VAEYFRKNPNQSIAKLISQYNTKSSAADSKVAKVFEEYQKDNDKIKKALMGESSGTGTNSAEQGSTQPAESGSQGQEKTKSEFEKKLKELSTKDSKATEAIKTYLKDEYNIDLKTDSASTQPAAVQASVAAVSSTVEVQQQQQEQMQEQQQQQQQMQQPQQQQPQQEQPQQETPPQEKTVDQIAKEDKDFYAPYFEIYNYQLPTVQSEGISALVTPDQLDFWFETKDNLKVDDYNFDFSLDQNQDEKSTDKTLKLNVNFEADSNFKLEVSPENVPFLDVSKDIVKESEAQSIESKAVNVAIEVTPSAPEKDHSSYRFTGWTFPITINTEGSKVQNELEKLVGNNHQGTLNNSLPYLLFQSDLDSIFKTAKLDSWFSISDTEKNNAKAYLKSTLNPITNEISLQKPKVEATPTPPAPAPANPPADSGAATTPAPGTSTPTPGTSTTPATSSGSSTDSSSSSSATAAAATSASSVANTATAFQDPATPAQEKEQTFAFGDYLINYLDKFAGFKLESGQKLAISSQY
ncbi:hypothetical protein, partial [Mesomycoplasma ovipneumoniae]